MKLHSLKQIVLPVFLSLSVLPLYGTTHTFAALTLNGNDLTGDTSFGQIGDVDVSSNHIEVFALSWESYFQADARSGKTTIGPLVIRKRLDQTTPLLAQGLLEGSTLTGAIKIFDTNPQGGETRHRFTYTIADGRITSVRHIVPDKLDAAATNVPPVEEIMITFTSLRITDEVNSTEYEVRPAAP